MTRIKKLIFSWFRKDFVRMAYEGSFRKQFDLERFDFAFYDLNGLAYYSFKDDKIPVLRKINTAMAYTKLCTGISDLDISESLQAINAALNEQDAKGKMTPNIGTIGFVCVQLLGRRGRVVVPDYLYELAANYFIRQDEDEDIPDDKIFLDKKECIKSLPVQVIRSFFFSKQLNEIFPFAENPEELFAEILREGEIETMAYLHALKNKSDGTSRRNTDQV